MEYTISTDKSLIDVDAVHDYLCHRSYWAKGRSLDRVKESIEHSLCFGMHDETGNMTGFARVVTDHVVFAYLMYMVIFEQYQGNGLGTRMVSHIMQQQDLQVRLWLLGTATAHGLYAKFGFIPLDNPERFMVKRDMQLC